MSERKLTDDEIMKALEVCIDGYCITNNCPLYSEEDNNDISRCTARMSKAALELIKKQKEKIDAYACINHLLEQDIANRDEMLKQKVEVVYEDFMKDYKCILEENESIYNELAELRKEVERLEAYNENLKSANAHVLGTLQDEIEKAKSETVKEFAEKAKQAICDNTYPDFDKDHKPVNVWKSKDGYDAIDELAEQILSEVTA